MLAIIILLALWVMWADYQRLKHLKGQISEKKHLIIGCLLTLNNLILPAIGIYALCLQDNTLLFTHIAMWGYWVWMMFALPRLIYYLFRHFHHPKVGIVGGIALAAFFLWGTTYGRTTLIVNEENYHCAKLPASFDGLRVVQLSDIHTGTIPNPEKELGQLVEKVNSLHPDLVIFTGDLVHIRHTEVSPKVQRILSQFKASFGVYSVMGNHDVGVYIHDTVALPRLESKQQLIALQEKMGWKVLCDTTVYLHRAQDSIALSGFDFDIDLRKKRHDRHIPRPVLEKVYEKVPATLFNLTIGHLPQLWEHILTTPYGDLTLAGHVHAMQAKVNIGGWKISPARLFYPRWSGRYEEGKRMLYINDGTGCGLVPMRLGAWPEITLITLKR